MKYLIPLLAILCVPVTTLAQSKNIVEASNQLAFDLYRLNSNAPGNIFFSPFSIEAALAMTSAGAQKETLSQMKKTLHLSSNSHSDFKALMSEMKSNQDFQLFIANRLWSSIGTNYDPAFLKILRENYEAEPVPLDFKNQPEPSRLMINQWVEEQTRQKIKDLLSKGSITPATDLVLTNAIYFKGTWIEPFEKKQTKEGPFHVSATELKSVPFMFQSSKFKIVANEDLQLLEMPYKGNELVMDVVLPKPTLKLSELEKKFNSQLFNELLAKLYRTEVQITIPKFKSESSMKLAKDLQTLGMTLAFDPQKANFRGIRKVNSGQPFSISEVVHKAFVDVNEEGTEAAAATGVIMMPTSMPSEPEIFKADRPFLYFIRHLKSGAILFMGRYSQP